MTEQKHRQIVPGETYKEKKGILWNKYMEAITPKLRQFQENTRKQLTDINQVGERQRVKRIKETFKVMEKYIDSSLLEFSGYVTALSLAYVDEHLQENNVKQKDVTKSVSQIFTKKKPTKKKTTSKRKRKSSRGQTKSAKKPIVKKTKSAKKKGKK